MVSFIGLFCKRDLSFDLMEAREIHLIYACRDSFIRAMTRFMRVVTQMNFEIHLMRRVPNQPLMLWGGYGQ